MVNVTVINIRSLFKFFCIAIVLILIFVMMKVVGGKINIIGQRINKSFVGCINNTLPKIKENEHTRKN